MPKQKTPARKQTTRAEEEELDAQEEIERGNFRPSAGHPSGVGEWTLRSARWVHGPSEMRSEETLHGFMEEYSKYEGSE